MEEKIDLSKILKDCPKGTKLYSTIFGEVEFEHIHNGSRAIGYKTNTGRNFDVSYEGKFFENYDGECTLFPSKDQRDWSEFTAPWYNKEPEPKFKVGDWIITPTNKVLQITSIEGTSYRFNNKSHYWEICYCDEECRLWNIQDAKDGDVLVHSSFMFDDFIFIYNNTSILQAYCYYSNERNRFIIEDRGHHCPWNMQEVKPATKEQCNLLFQKIKEAGYKWNVETKTLEKLVEPKFNPKTLKPFDRVLTRDSNSEKWHCNYFSYIDYGDIYFPYATSGGAGFAYCIPYNEDTQHLVGTCDEPADYYKYWEE